MSKNFTSLWYKYGFGVSVFQGHHPGVASRMANYTIPVLSAEESKSAGYMHDMHTVKKEEMPKEAIDLQDFLTNQKTP